MSKNGFDPSVYNDDLALKIDWKMVPYTVCSMGREYDLVQTSPSRLKFIKSEHSRSTAMFLMFLGVVSLAILLLSDSGGSVFGKLAVAAIAIVTFYYGFRLLKKGSEEKVFDKGSGYYRQGKENPDARGGHTSRYECRIADIHAVQLLKSRLLPGSFIGHNGGIAIGSSNKYRVYQINLVLKSGKRVNVVCHGPAESAVLEDAKRVADFLEIPLWDATKYYLEI